MITLDVIVTLQAVCQLVPVALLVAGCLVVVNWSPK
jgi:hypothetical protein